MLKNKCSNFSFAIAPPGQYLQKDNFMEWLWIRGQQTGCPCPNPLIAKLLTLTTRVTLKFYQLLPTLRLSSAVNSFGNHYNCQQLCQRLPAVESFNSYYLLLVGSFDRAHICHEYQQLYSWRKICHVEKFQISVKILNNLWSYIEIYAVFVLNLCGEKSLWKKSV